MLHPRAHFLWKVTPLEVIEWHRGDPSEDFLARVKCKCCFEKTRCCVEDAMNEQGVYSFHVNFSNFQLPAFRLKHSSKCV